MTYHYQIGHFLTSLKQLEGVGMGKVEQNNAHKKKRSPLRVGLSSTLFVAAAVLMVFISTQIDIDRRFFVMVLLLLVGVFILSQVINRTPKNTQEEKDEAETCAPIIEAYHKHKSTEKLMETYAAWKSGEHTTYTRMHFAEQIINELCATQEYETALNVLYEAGTLPFKGREHYDYDKYRTVCEKQLLSAINSQKTKKSK